MTGLIVLILGCVAVAVLLACLRGFSQAQRYRRVEGVFVDVKRFKGRLPERRNSNLTSFAHRKADPSREPAAHPVCSRTAALVEMAIILGSRNVGSAVTRGRSDPKPSRFRRDPWALRREMENDPRSRVQPLNHS